MLYLMRVSYRGQVLASKEEYHGDPIVALNHCRRWGQEIIALVRSGAEDLTGNKIKDEDFEFRVKEVVEQLLLFPEGTDVARARS